MKKIVLMRHGESEWNQENRFTGWMDIDLSEKGIREACEAALLLMQSTISFDIAYTSYLKRAIKTVNAMLDTMNLDWIPVEKTWRLNEKHYGVLQGKNKRETTEKYGDKQVMEWRRSYDVAPIPINKEDVESPFHDSRYRMVPPSYLPLGESLKDCIERIIPYWDDVIYPSLIINDTILIVAHSNSLRGIVKHLKNISDQDIVSLNIPTAIPYIFEFDDHLQVIKDYFLGDEETITALMQAVANQSR